MTDTDTERLPCGCVVATDVINGVKTLSYMPCSVDCRYYQWFLDEAAQQGKPTTVIDAR